MLKTVYYVVTDTCTARFTPREVYYLLREKEIPHDEAANAEGWCELAGVGEEYETDDFIITIREEDI